MNGKVGNRTKESKSQGLSKVTVWILMLACAAFCLFGLFLIFSLFHCDTFARNLTFYNLHCTIAIACHVTGTTYCVCLYFVLF